MRIRPALAAALCLTLTSTSLVRAAQDAAEIILNRLAQRPPLCATMHWNGYSVAKQYDFMDTSQWVQPVAPDGRTAQYDIDLCVLGEDFQASVIGPMDHYATNLLSWVGGELRDATDEGGYMQVSRSPEANSGLPYTINFMTLIDGWVIQENASLADLARRGLLTTTAVQESLVEFEARDPAWTSYVIIRGVLDLERGGLPISLSINHAPDGSYHPEYLVLESQEVGGVHMPTRAIVAWVNGGATPTWLQEFTVLAWRVDERVTRESMAAYVSARTSGAPVACSTGELTAAPDGASAPANVTGDTTPVLSAAAAQPARSREMRSLSLAGVGLTALVALWVATRRRRAVPAAA